MSSGEAILSWWDSVREIPVEIPIRWNKGYDVDARYRIPGTYKEEWEIGVRQLRADHWDGEAVDPYPTLPIQVPIKDLTKTATGAFAIALVVFDQVGWRVRPPYPTFEEDETPLEVDV